MLCTKGDPFFIESLLISLYSPGYSPNPDLDGEETTENEDQLTERLKLSAADSFVMSSPPIFPMTPLTKFQSESPMPVHVPERTSPAYIDYLEMRLNEANGRNQSLLSTIKDKNAEIEHKSTHLQLQDKSLRRLEEMFRSQNLELPAATRVRNHLNADRAGEPIYIIDPATYHIRGYTGLRDAIVHRMRWAVSPMQSSIHSEVS